MKYHVSENYLFLSLEKPYDIALQFDFVHEKTII